MFMKNFKVTFLNCTFLEILHLLCRKDTWGFLFSPFWKRKYNTWWYLIQVVINLMVNNLHSFFSKKWYTPDWDKNIHKKIVSDLIIHILICIVLYLCTTNCSKKVETNIIKKRLTKFFCGLSVFSCTSNFD